MSSRRGREFWERASAEVDAGATLDTVARRLGVKVNTLKWWRWRLRADQRKSKSSSRRKAVGKLPRRRAKPQGHFLPVVVRDVPAPVADAVAVVVDGVRIHVPIGADPIYVARLVEALRARC